MSVQSSRSFFPIDGAHENNITSDQSSLGSSHGHSLQITEEGAGLREGGRTVEDETEYETVKRRSALLILLFDLRLGSSLIYMTPLRQHIGTIRVYQLSHTLHVYSKYAATRDSLQYANNIFSQPFSLLHAHHQSPHIKSQFEPRFMCLKCRVFATKQGIYVDNMQLFTLEAAYCLHICIHKVVPEADSGCICN